MRVVTTSAAIKERLKPAVLDGRLQEVGRGTHNAKGLWRFADGRSQRLWKRRVQLALIHKCAEDAVPNDEHRAKVFVKAETGPG